MTTVGVLCARVRVEEKQMMAALAEAGVRPTALPPATAPLSIGARSTSPSPLPSNRSNGVAGAAQAARVMVDRCQDRAAAAAIVTACRALGTTTVDAGVAATGDRLAVAAALAAAGLPRPETRLACCDVAALEAIAEFGYPATLLPLAAGTPPVALLDVDTAEAVLEHRAVLGSGSAALALVQAGAPAPPARAAIIVVDGSAVAWAAVGAALPPPATARELAEATARALGAAFLAVELVRDGAGWVVWDVQPVPEFRHAEPFGCRSVAEALAAAVVARLGGPDEPALTTESIGPVQIEFESTRWESGAGREVRDGVVLTA